MGKDFCDEKFLSSEEIFCLYCLCFVFSACFFSLLPSIVFFHFAKIADEGTTPLDRSGTATSGGLAGDGQRAVTALLWINESPARGDPRGYTVTGTVRRPPTDSRGRVGREVRIVDEIKL